MKMCIMSYQQRTIFFLLRKYFNKWARKLKPSLVIVLTNLLYKLNFVWITLLIFSQYAPQKCFRNLELFWTSSYELWIMNDVLTHRFHVVNAFYCSISTRVLSIHNCAKCFKFWDNKANTARWGIISRSSIPSECPLCSYNEAVALKQSWTITVRWMIENLSIFSIEEEKYHYAVKFIVISVSMI